MRLFSGKVSSLSDELVKALEENRDIEFEERKEVVLDIESVFRNYLEIEREVSDKAREVLQQRSLPPTELGRIRKLLAEQKGIKIGEEMMDFLLDQLIEVLLHSNNVEEVYVPDHDLRRRMRPALKKYLEADEALETEVRSKLKHVQEGTRTWEVEYERVKAEVQRRKGLK